MQTKVGRSSWKYPSGQNLTLLISLHNICMDTVEFMRAGRYHQSSHKVKILTVCLNIHSEESGDYRYKVSFRDNAYEPFTNHLIHKIIIKEEKFKAIWDTISLCLLHCSAVSDPWCVCVIGLYCRWRSSSSCPMGTGFTGDYSRNHSPLS